jgi:hypothetical protein
MAILRPSASGHLATVATASSTPESCRSFEMVLASAGMSPLPRHNPLSLVDPAAIDVIEEGPKGL